MRRVSISLRAWFERLGGLFRKPQRDADFAAELESHLDLHTEDNVRNGMTREALLKLGGVEQTKESYRDQRGIPLLESFLRNVRLGARMLLKNPGSTAAVVFALALGIGRPRQCLQLCAPCC